MPTVRRIVASHGVSRVVGHRIQIVGNALWRTGKRHVWSPAAGNTPTSAGSLHSPPPVVANSRISSSLRGKLTYVESLLVRTLESEKRLRSEGGKKKPSQGSTEGRSLVIRGVRCFVTQVNIRSTRIRGNLWMLKRLVHFRLLLHLQHI